MIVVFTGNGKGKTTASLGQAFRALGRGKRVLMIQFIKGPWKSGEDELVKKLHTQHKRLMTNDKELVDGLESFYDFDIKKMGLGFVGILGDQLPKEEHAKAAEAGLKLFIEQLATNNFDMLILDEINVATSLGLLTEEHVLKALENVPEEKIVVLTGRGAPQSFIDRADLVTEMREIKHPFASGKLGKAMVEF